MTRFTCAPRPETTTRSIADSISVAMRGGRIKGWNTNKDGSRTIFISENYSLIFRCAGGFYLRERRTKEEYRVSGTYVAHDDDAEKDVLTITTLRKKDGEDTNYAFEFAIKEGI